jgi:hypothetical protein
MNLRIASDNGLALNAMDRQTIRVLELLQRRRL